MALGLPKRVVSRCRCTHRNCMALIELLQPFAAGNYLEPFNGEECKVERSFFVYL